MVTLSGWSKRKMVSRWQGSKSWAWPVSGTAPLHTWVFTSAHARVLGAFVYLGILAYLCCVHLHTFPYLYTGGTQHHQWVLRLWKYTSANSLDNNSQSERIPSEEGSRVQIGQNAMALEGGGQSGIRIIKLNNLELKLWPRILIIFSLQYCMHVSTVCIICTTFFSPPGWLFNEQPATKQPRLGWGRHFVHRARGYIFFCFIFSNWIFHLPNGIILSRPAFWTQTLAFRCEEVPGAPLPPDTKALILLHTLKMKFNRTRQGL